VVEPTGYATRWKQVNNEGTEEVFGSRQKFLALMIGSEGRSYFMKKASDVELTPPVLVVSKKSGNPCDSDMQLGWSAPSVACKPVAPTPAMM
jgi:hypothetical protein